MPITFHVIWPDGTGSPAKGHCACFGLNRYLFKKISFIREARHKAIGETLIMTTIPVQLIHRIDYGIMIVHIPT